jgi:hypothetical protein
MNADIVPIYWDGTGFVIGAPSRIRTYDRSLKRRLLYQLSYRRIVCHLQLYIYQNSYRRILQFHFL